jgi:hypothetical protein
VFAPHLQRVANLNINGNPLDQMSFEGVVESLKTLPELRSVYINLY